MVNSVTTRPLQSDGNREQTAECLKALPGNTYTTQVKLTGIGQKRVGEDYESGGLRFSSSHSQEKRTPVGLSPLSLLVGVINACGEPFIGDESMPNLERVFRQGSSKASLRPLVDTGCHHDTDTGKRRALTRLLPRIVSWLGSGWIIGS